MGVDVVSDGKTPNPSIQVLSDHIVNQIAAGEVVERPSSIVKELVENALDAGASHISIDIEDGGKALIRVSDNGHGMSPQNCAMALVRHATSKLRDTKDLLGLSTLGFRGEALPSIASVSQLRIVSRTHDMPTAMQVCYENGSIVEENKVGAPVGTTIEVHKLFENTPVRKKFLRSSAAEMTAISDTVTSIALSQPLVHFRLRHNNRVFIDAPRHAGHMERMHHLLGKKIGQNVHREHGREGDVVVDAFLCSPAFAQGTSRAFHFFAEGRAVRDRGAWQAARIAYGDSLPTKRFPVAVVFVTASPGFIDINVHPQKAEVRYADAQLVYRVLRHTIRRGVAAAGWNDKDLLPEVSVLHKQRSVSSSATNPIGSPVTGVDFSAATEMASLYAQRQEAALRRGKTKGDIQNSLWPDSSSGGNKSETAKRTAHTLSKGLALPTLQKEEEGSNQRLSHGTSMVRPETDTLVEGVAARDGAAETTATIQDCFVGLADSSLAVLCVNQDIVLVDCDAVYDIACEHAVFSKDYCSQNILTPIPRRNIENPVVAELAVKVGFVWDEDGNVMSIPPSLDLSTAEDLLRSLMDCQDAVTAGKLLARELVTHGDFSVPEATTPAEFFRLCHMAEIRYPQDVVSVSAKIPRKEIAKLLK